MSAVAEGKNAESKRQKGFSIFYLSFVIFHLGQGETSLRALENDKWQMANGKWKMENGKSF